ncbi:hypothetical protein Sjap_017141 [Stephania japonica]|uniref:Transposase n=1 Tax=Stephania japonica TaxID=461633 RepID=A0AAP0I5P4_9MAGN
MGVCGDTDPKVHPKVWFTWDEHLSWRIYYVWLRKEAKRYTDNVGKIAKKRHAPIYLTDEVFQYYKHMRATDKEFVEKLKKMSENRKSEKGGPRTGMSLHNYGSISAVEHNRNLRSCLGLRRPLVDENAVYLEVVKSIKGRLYRLGPHGYISTPGESSSHGPAYGPHGNDTQGKDFEEALRQEILERKRENQELRDGHARVEALVYGRFGIIPPSTEQPPPPSTNPYSRHLDDL